MRQDFLTNFHDSAWPTLIVTNTLMYSYDKRMHTDKIIKQGGRTTQKNAHWDCTKSLLSKGLQNMFHPALYPNF